MIRKSAFHVLILLASAAQLSGQTIATIEVDLSRRTAGIGVPVRINLDEITTLHDSTITLFEISGAKRTPVSHQLENKSTRILYWIIPPAKTETKKKVFELVKRSSVSSPAEISCRKNNGTLTIQAGEKKLLQYNYKTVYPPPGVDTSFKRSGFIHPLWSPNGQELTRISPPDHYHHYGLWNPWTKVLFESDTVDFWNLAAKQGTVRFANFVSISEGPVYGEYQVLQEHVAFKAGEERIALNELQTVRIYKPVAGQDHYIADITIQLNNPNEEEVILLEYRYGGLGWRATEKWNRDNSETITSEGKTRKNADGSKARWCIVQGSIDNDYAGIVLMSNPTNYNYPEPLRIWPETTNNRGDVFANFSPTKDKNWILHKKQDYTLKYRLLVYNGRMTKETAEAAWKYFAEPHRITIINKLNKR